LLRAKGNVGRLRGFGRAWVRQKTRLSDHQDPSRLKHRGSAESGWLQTICTVYGDIAFWLRDSPPPLYRFVPVVKVAAPPLISTVDYRNEARGRLLGNHERTIKPSAFAWGRKARAQLSKKTASNTQAFVLM
jgi:hypothetical protein